MIHIYVIQSGKISLIAQVSRFDFSSRTQSYEAGFRVVFLARISHTCMIKGKAKHRRQTLVTSEFVIVAQNGEYVLLYLVSSLATVVRVGKPK